MVFAEPKQNPTRSGRALISWPGAIRMSLWSIVMLSRSTPGQSGVTRPGRTTTRSRPDRMPHIDAPLLFLTQVLASPLLDPTGERLGRVADLIVRLADSGYPPVTGLKARIGRRDLFVPAQSVTQLTAQGAKLEGQTLNLGRFERRPGEVLLRGENGHAA